MDAMFAVRRLGIRSVELVPRIRHVTVRWSLVRLTGPPATQRLVGMVETAPHDHEALVSRVVERAVCLRAPQPMLLGDQLLNPIQDSLFVHAPSITSRRASSAPATQSRSTLRLCRTTE